MVYSCNSYFFSLSVELVGCCVECLVLEFSNCSEEIVANWVIIMWKAHQVPLRGFNESTVSLKDKSNPVMELGLQTWGLN